MPPELTDTDSITIPSTAQGHCEDPTRYVDGSTVRISTQHVILFSSPPFHSIKEKISFGKETPLPPCWHLEISLWKRWGENSHNLKLIVNCFEEYTAVAFVAIAVLCNDHLCLILRRFNHPKRSPCPTSNPFTFPLLHPSPIPTFHSRQTLVCSPSLPRYIFWIFHGNAIVPYVTFSVGFLSPSVMFQGPSLL